MAAGDSSGSTRLAALAAPVMGQNPGGGLTPAQLAVKAKAQNVPQISYESAPNFLKWPPGLYMGEGIGVATNSKGHIFVYTRSQVTRLFEFDQTGKYRTTDNGEPTCTIAGDGLLFGLGEDGMPVQFHGPGELGDVLVTSGLLETCLVLQMYRFAHGHREHDEDAPSIDALSTMFAQSHKFDELMLELVSADAFGYRQVRLHRIILAAADATRLDRVLPVCASWLPR